MKRKTTEYLISIGMLLNVINLRQRGWTGEKIRTLLPKPIYISGVPFWKLRDVERAEASAAFYLFDEVN